MIRTFNYTRRRKIPRSRISITLHAETGGIRSFHAVIDLEGLGLAADAHVYVEAYRRTSYMRFDYGTVAGRVPPQDRRLTEIDGEICFFRVKVIDQSQEIGRILADADGIPPANIENIGASRICLLHVDYRDLGQAIWQLELDDPMPVLVMNDQIDGIREIVRSDYHFQSLVFPAVVRQVLQKILVLDEHDPTEEEDTWRCHWMRFARNLNAEECPKVGRDGSGQGDCLQWIERVVQAYCERHRLREKYVQTDIAEAH